jgi:hypothetical protein
MKALYTLIISCFATSAWAAPTQIIGEWPEPLRIEAAQHDAKGWHFVSGAQTLTITAPPAWTQPAVGEWLKVELRHHPAGMMRQVSWSSDGQAAPHLILAQNVALVGQAIPDWRWDSGPVLVQQQQHISLKVGKVSKIQGWCVLISDWRPAKASKAGIANETETRFDWWAQYNPKQCK